MSRWWFGGGGGNGGNGNGAPPPPPPPPTNKEVMKKSLSSLSLVSTGSELDDDKSVNSVNSDDTSSEYFDALPSFSGPGHGHGHGHEVGGSDSVSGGLEMASSSSSCLASLNLGMNQLALDDANDANDNDSSSAALAPAPASNASTSSLSTVLEKNQPDQDQPRNYVEDAAAGSSCAAQNRDEEARLVLDMHASLTDQERKAIGDDEHEQKHSCARFLRATCTTKRDKKTSLIVEVTYSFDKALARARDTIAFHKSTATHAARHEGCFACQKEKCSHYLHLIGVDKKRRPVAYSAFSRAKSKKLDENRAHVIATMTDAEKLIAFMRRHSMYPHFATCEEPDPWKLGRHHERLVWAVDFHGFGVRDMSINTSIMFLEVMSKHFPERVGKILLLSAPGLFSGLWKVIQRVVDPVTYEKIEFIPASKDRADHGACKREHLQAAFGDELGNWVYREMLDVRQRSPKDYFAGTPYVPPHPLRGSSPDKCVDRGAHVNEDGHCHLGEASYLDILEAWSKQLKS